MAKNPNTIDFIEFPASSAVDLDSAKSFYANAFGWKFKDWGDNYAETSESGLGCGFSADPEHRPSKPLAVIYTRLLEATRTGVISAGGVITKEIFGFPGGRRFHFTDPAGNELAVWSDL